MNERAGIIKYPTDPIVNKGELPDPFALPNGGRVRNREEWSATPCLGREGEIPFDQHCLLAAIAPRPLLLAYALDDRWSNPEGMVQCAWAAGEVYRFLGSPDHLAFHLRPGAHSHSPEDWDVLLDFIGWKWRGQQPIAPYNAHPYAHLRQAFAWKDPEGER